MEFNMTVRVMLVDDHAIVREGYRRLISDQEDLQVVAEHADADAAYESLQQSQGEGLDVIVVDLSMPGRGGLDLIRRVVQRWPAMRVLVFSMHDHPATVQQAMTAGATGYVSKTAPPDELIAAVRRVARGEAGVLSAELQHTADAAPPHASLSPREFEVMRLLLEGTTVELIAERLFISPKTVANLQTSIRQKLNVTQPMGLWRYAQRYGLLGANGELL
jgi:DNA-binding NarL/FixJ family response regulator